jgi:hypothetical protein
MPSVEREPINDLLADVADYPLLVGAGQAGTVAT